MLTSTRRIRQRLEREGWYLARNGSGHDIYRHSEIGGIITVPRHRDLSPGVVRSIGKKADWPEYRSDMDLH